jgi:hypothetical protein
MTTSATCPYCGVKLETIKGSSSDSVFDFSPEEGGRWHGPERCHTLLVKRVVQFREALERIAQTHPSLVKRGGGPAPWLIAKAALLNLPLDASVVCGEWGKTEPAVRRGGA